MQERGGDDWGAFFADNIRAPWTFSAVQYVFRGAEFHWQARTPAVDEDVDPPK